MVRATRFRINLTRRSVATHGQLPPLPLRQGTKDSTVEEADLGMFEDQRLGLPERGREVEARDTGIDEGEGAQKV